MMRTIHPTALIHASAELGERVRIGPYVVIDEGVRIGDDCDLGPHVYITGETLLGARNKIHAGAVIGDLPQDLRFQNQRTRVIVGDDNVIREHVTIHRSNHPDQPTRIGSKNLLMAQSHVGHNAVIGDQVIIVNGALVAGHSEVQDRAFISGTCLIHQFTRIGTLALMQGGSGASKDVPPFTIVTGNNRICGLNVVGLRRAGFTSEERLELRRLYHAAFRNRERFRDLMPRLEAEFRSDKSRIVLDFLKSSKRGFCIDKPGEQSSPEQ